MERKLTVKRQRRLMLTTFKATVVLDGKTIASLKNGEDVTCQMSEGEHTLIVSGGLAYNDAKLTIPEGDFDVELTTDFRAVNSRRGEWYFFGVDGKMPWWYSRSEINDPIERAQKGIKR